MYKSKGQLNKADLGHLTEAQTGRPIPAQVQTHMPPQPGPQGKKRRPLGVLLIFCACLLLAGGFFFGSQLDLWEGGAIAVEELTSLTITLNINSQPQTISTNSVTVSQLLREQRLRLSSADYIGLEMDQPLYNGMKIWLRLAVPITIIADGETHQVLSQPITVQEALDQAGVVLGELDQVSRPLLSYIYDAEEVKVSRVEIREEQVEEEIEPPVVTREYTYLAPGGSTEIYPGKAGKQLSTYAVTYQDGVETKRELISSEVVTEPEDCIMGYGPATIAVTATVGEDGQPELLTATTEDGASFFYTRSFIAEATAYTWTGNQTATGTWPAEGRTIAVDPTVIPLGSKVYVVGYGFAVAEDTGGAVKGNIIDLYKDDEQDCINWGRRNVTIYILPD